MARITGPKHRLARREGVNVLEKQSASLDRKMNVPPGIHGRKGGRRKVSGYRLQLREKQKLKKFYGLLEKQFRKYVVEAQKERTNTEDALLRLLESRLDNLVFRLKLANSRFQARQYVSHGHVLVNDKKVNIPSYSVKEGDIVALSPKLVKNEVIAARLSEEVTLPDYLVREAISGKVVRYPKREEIQNPVDYQLVIEFYSR